jgi:D-alanine-D-alanine ligase
VTLDNGETLKFDVCFNIIHGTPGENGILQAYWDAIGQKYTGCDFYQSALLSIKKILLPYFKIWNSFCKSVYLRKGEEINVDEIIELNFPFCKT